MQLLNEMIIVRQYLLRSTIMNRLDTLIIYEKS